MQHRKHFLRNTTLGLGLIAGLGLGIALFSDSTQAVQADASDTLTVGTYDAQSAFEQYPGREAMMQQMQQMQQAQQQMQQAQQQGDQQKLMQIQQELEQLQQETIAKFYSEIDEVLPEIAEKQGVKVVAMEVVYTSDDVNSSDLTEQIVERFEE